MALNPRFQLVLLCLLNLSWSWWIFHTTFGVLEQYPTTSGMITAVACEGGGRTGTLMVEISDRRYWGPGVVMDSCRKQNQKEGRWADIEYSSGNDVILGLKIDGEVIFSRAVNAFFSGFFWLVPLLFINIVILPRIIRSLRSK